jgi:hypothetical protein
MSLVFEGFEELRQKLTDWRKRDEFSLDVALWTEIELETLLAELPVAPFDEWIDGIGPGKYWGGYVGGKPFVIEFCDSPQPSISVYWRETGWPDEPFAWSFLNQIRDFPVRIIRPGFWIRNSWEPHREALFTAGPNPFARFPFPYEWEFYRSGSRSETEQLFFFLADFGFETGWRIGPPSDQAVSWFVREIQPDGSSKVEARHPRKENGDRSAWYASLNRPESKYLVIRDDEKAFGIGVKNGQPLPDWPPKPSE